ncbi:glycosyltransferase [Ruicaihuangia caeni]|uniref:glycosyltransferase n=1 Tax=Ruicaihuangia caeni TaxID=3042517 RepID=UPI00338F2493
MLAKTAKRVAGRILRLIPEPLLGRILPGQFRFDPREMPAPTSRPDGDVRVLIAPTNYAGQGYEWARAIERHIDGAGAASMVCRVGRDFRHPADDVVPLGFYAASRTWQRRQRESVARDFTHVIVEAEKQPFGAVLDETVAGQVEYLRKRGVKVAMLCHGTDIRLPSRHQERDPESPFNDALADVAPTLERNAIDNRRLLDALGAPVFVSTPDLLLDVPYATWLPVVVDGSRWGMAEPPLLRERPVVAHAPSSGSVKGSELIDPIVQRLADEGLIEYRRIEKVPYERMPEVYRTADIVLDQFRLGDYGVAACEAMAAGRVVVGHVSDHARSKVREVIGRDLPIVEATASTLEQVLRDILAEPDRYRGLAAEGPAFVADAHDGRRSAEALREFLAPGGDLQQPLVDMVIPIHDPSRPIQRTVDSLLESGLEPGRELRINVVCHNIAADEIAAVLTPEALAACRLLELHDGHSSPAGPFMHGIRSATARYVSIMGSDDTLEPGALKAWLDAAVAANLTALIPPERHASGAKVRTPPVRPWRRGPLHPIKDRLAYRTAPLGLIRRDVVDSLQLDMPSRLRAGSDQLFGVKLWFLGRRTAYGRGMPSYVVGADAKSRVTFTVRRADDELRAVRELITDSWVRGLPRLARRAIVTKSVRVHVFSAALLRTDADRWTDDDRAYIAELIRHCRETAPDFERPLSLADRALVDALLAGDRSTAELRRLLAARRRFGHPLTVLTRDPRGLLAVDGPIRFMVAAKLL